MNDNQCAVRHCRGRMGLFLCSVPICDDHWTEACNSDEHFTTFWLFNNVPRYSEEWKMLKAEVEELKEAQEKNKRMRVRFKTKRVRLRERI